MHQLRSFNPHPAFRPGDAGGIGGIGRTSIGFNPHPAFRPGDARDTLSMAQAIGVSIRTRPFGRVMHFIGDDGVVNMEFQSAPGLSAG